MGGCSLRVSFTTDFRYLSSCTSLTSMVVFPFNASLISVCALAIAAGFLISSAIAQLIVFVDDSVPAANASCVQVAVLLHPEHNIDDIFFTFELAAARLQSMLLHDPLKNGVDAVVHSPQLVFVPIQEIHQFGGRKHIDQLIPCNHGYRLIHQPFQHVDIPDHTAKHRSANDGTRQRTCLFRQIDGRGRRPKGQDETRHLVLPDQPERPYVSGAEQLRHEYFAHLPPVRAVGAEVKVVAVVKHHPCSDSVSLVRAGEVLLFHQLFRRLWRRNYHGEDFSELQMNHGAVFLGYAAKHMLQEAAGQEVEVADHRQLRWAWR